MSILGKVKTCFLICKEKHVKREYSWRCPKFLQERRRWWQSPGKILKKAVYFFTSFPSYLLISFALSTSPPSLFLSFLILPLDFWAIFFHFLYILAHSSDTLLREIYFVKDSGRQIQRNEPSIVKLFSWVGRIFMSRKCSQRLSLWHLFSIYGTEMMDVCGASDTLVEYADG